MKLKEELNDYSNYHSFEMFNSKFNECIEETCKLEKPKITKRNRITNPWITQGLINSIDKKNRLYKIWQKSKNMKNKTGDPKLYEAYKSHRRLLKNLIISAKKMYYASKFEKNEGNMKKTWDIINKLRGKSKNEIKPNFCIDNERIICRRLIANKFNDYFTSLAINLNKSAQDGIDKDSIPQPDTYLAPPCPSSIFLEDCTDNEIIEIIKEFENGKASDIPVVIVKATTSIISPILCKLYNNCMLTGTFPNILKTAKITPVYKKGNRECFENYRPIATLPIFGKIFEKLIYSRIYRFLIAKNILVDTQFGFRKGHSTSHAINYSVNIINDARMANKHVIGLFIDLSKAFDTIHHQILLQKLQNYGIRGVAFNLIESYLTDRMQYTSVLGHNSDHKKVLYGVPQGSVLGPLLFLLYINDLTNSYCIDSNIKFVLYADDTNIFIIASSREAAIQKANELLLNINKYMLSNLLHINIDKCCYIHFPPSRTFIGDGNKTDIKLNNIIIKEVTEAKFLGVIIDKNLTWLPHLEYVKTKLKLSMSIISRIKYNIPTKNYKSLYYSLFESHMSYCISVWGGVSKTNLNKLFVTQKQCIRILFGDSNKQNEKLETAARCRPFGDQKLGNKFHCKEHTKPLFQKIGLLAVQNVHKYQTCLEIIKILKYRTPISIYSLLNQSSRECSELLILPRNSNTFLYHASKIWNTALKNIIVKSNKDISTLKLATFKLNFKECLLNMQNMSDPLEWIPDNFDIQHL